MRLAEPLFKMQANGISRLWARCPGSVHPCRMAGSWHHALQTGRELLMSWKSRPKACLSQRPGVPGPAGGTSPGRAALDPPLIQKNIRFFGCSPARNRMLKECFKHSSGGMSWRDTSNSRL